MFNNFGWDLEMRGVKEKPMHRLLFKFFVVCSISILFISEIQAGTLKRVGYAYDTKINVLLYTETHHEEYIDDKVCRWIVYYTDANGKIFAKKKLDFSSNRTLPEFKLLNTQNGHHEELDTGQDRARYIFDK